MYYDQVLVVTNRHLFQQHQHIIMETAIWTPEDPLHQQYYYGTNCDPYPGYEPSYSSYDYDFNGYSYNNNQMYSAVYEEQYNYNYPPSPGYSVSSSTPSPGYSITPSPLYFIFPRILYFHLSFPFIMPFLPLTPFLSSTIIHNIL